MLARLGRVFLVAAFLLAQQSAFAHQIWHFGSGGKLQAAGEPGTKGNPLCDQHEALGTVLGGLSSALVVALFSEPRPASFPAANSPAASEPSPSPVSRGPPLFL